MNSPWIDAKERLPEPDQRVIVHFGPTGQFTEAVISYHGDNGVWRSVLFWMPIPEVPKPDPFEEWWRNYIHEPRITLREHCQRAWNAGFHWSISHPETDDAWSKAPGERE